MLQYQKTRDLLISHYNRYPKLKIQDIFKYLYQSTFGCEHLASSLQDVTNNILKEYNGLYYNGEPDIEELDGDFSRVPISYIKNGLSVNTMGNLFLSSAKKQVEGLSVLTEKLVIVKQLISEKLLPFSENEFNKAVSDWKSCGFSPIHHSEAFKQAYHPSYRVISNEFIPYLPLFSALDRLLCNGPVKLAVEGGSASGKTTLSNMLLHIYDCTVFHMDDFFLRPEQRCEERFAQIGGNIDRERFLQEVLEPLSKGETVNYRKFDCSTMSISNAIQVIPKKLTVIEGVYSMHPKFEEYYDFSVYLNISSQLQNQRINKRNSPEFAKRFFEEWIPLENVYFDKTKIIQRCSMKIDIQE